jgi:hypothetical protein
MTESKRPQPADPTLYEPRYAGEQQYRFQRKTGSFRPRPVWRTANYDPDALAAASAQQGHYVEPCGWATSAKDAWEDEQEYYADNTLFRRPRESP